MSIKERLEADLKRAMKARDGRRTGCIRMLKSKLLEKEVALRAKRGKDYGIPDEEALEVISSYAKQRRDSIESYEKGGREDLAAGERAELEIVGEYLPQPLAEPELRQLIEAAIAESGAASVEDRGAVMKLVMPQTRGRADGKTVQQLARTLLEK